MKETHISLSRTVYLQYDQVNAFTLAIKSALKDYSRFRISLEGGKMFTNDEHTTTFLSLSLKLGVAEVLRLISQVDKVLQKFSLPAYYEEMDLHATLAWAVGDWKYQVDKDVQLQNSIGAIAHGNQSELKEIEFTVGSVQCQIGNRHFEHPLIDH